MHVCTKLLKLPLIPLNEQVIMPGVITPLTLIKNYSIKVSLKVKKKSPYFIVATKINDKIQDIGTLGQLTQKPESKSQYKIIEFQGLQRVKLASIFQEDEMYWCIAEIVQSDNLKLDQNFFAFYDSLQKFVDAQNISEDKRKNENIYIELLKVLNQIKDPEQFLDLTVTYLNFIDFKVKQQILAELDFFKRLSIVNYELQKQTEIEYAIHEINTNVKNQINEQHKLNFLKEKLKAIQKILGDDDEAYISELEEKLNKLPLNLNAKKKALSELQKLKISNSVISAETPIIQTYLENIINIPWGKFTSSTKSIKFAEEILNQEHLGLKKVKTRILEHIAIEKRINERYGEILCLVGAPGVGKTSIASAIAKAMNRNFAKIALGGLKDDAEIYGHRKTYIGAMPGNIIKALQTCGSMNPIILLDEIDKLDCHHSNIYATFLEILDPQQNKKFQDRYLGFELDLSNVTFVCTANSLTSIPEPLLDRMEIIELSAYTQQEKSTIAFSKLIPANLKKYGAQDTECCLTDCALTSIVKSYTHEAGLRELNNCLKKIVQKVIYNNEINDTKIEYTINQSNLEDYLGSPIYLESGAYNEQRVGEVLGLGWAPSGGSILPVQAILLPEGKNNIVITGKLGDVMQESIKIALSLVRQRTGFDFTNYDIHIHAPAGSINKNGPSAGIAIATAILSACAKISINQKIAMTGEIDLFGNILPVGGIREKLIAAYNANIHSVIIPFENKFEIIELPIEVQRLKIYTLKKIEDAWDLIFDYQTSSSDLLLSLKVNPRAII